PDDSHLDFMRLLGGRRAFLCASLCDLSACPERSRRVLCGCLRCRRQHKKDSVEQIVNAASMLRRNRKDIPHPKRMKFAKQRIMLVRVHLVDGKKERLPS